MERKRFLRTDGKPDLTKWEDYIKETGLKTISEFKAALKECNFYEDKINFENAIRKRSNEIASEIVENFVVEGLTISESLSLLETTKEKILMSKVNH